MRIDWREWLRPVSMRVLSPEGKPSRGELILFAGIVVTAIIFRFVTLTKDAFWIDEGLTWAIVDLPFSYLWTVPFDAHPPLYYTIQKAWLIFGDSEFAMRSLSALLGLALPAVMFPFIRKHLGVRSAALVACLVLLSYTLIVHSSTIRSYALLLIFGTAAAIQIIELTSLSDLSLKSREVRNRSLLYILYQTAALYTHLIAIVHAAALGASIVLVSFLIHRRLTPTLKVLGAVAAINAIVVALWAPWPLFMMASADDFGWLHQASIIGAIKTFSETVGPNGFGKFGEAPILLLLATGLIFSIRRAPPPILVFIIANLVAIPAAVYVTGFIKPVFMERTILQAILGGSVALVVLLRCLPSNTLRQGLTAGLLMIYGASCVTYVTRSGQLKYQGDKLQLVENFRNVAAQISKTGNSEAILICREDQEIPALYYYMRNYPEKTWLLIKDDQTYTIDPEHWINFKKVPVSQRTLDLIAKPVPATAVESRFDRLDLVISRGCLYTWQSQEPMVQSMGYEFSGESHFAWVTDRVYLLHNTPRKLTPSQK